MGKIIKYTRKFLLGLAQSYIYQKIIEYILPQILALFLIQREFPVCEGGGESKILCFPCSEGLN